MVKSISRFARNTKDCLKVTRDLKVIGVSVCFVEQNIDTAMVSGEMMTAIFASLAQKESESISKNMRMSYQRRIWGRENTAAPHNGHDKKTPIKARKIASASNQIFEFIASPIIRYIDF